LFWRELLRTYFGYMLVGVAFLPAGLLYGVTQLYGWNNRWILVGLLLLSLPLAQRLWQLRYVPGRARRRIVRALTMVYPSQSRAMTPAASCDLYVTERTAVVTFRNHSLGRPIAPDVAPSGHRF